jgi:hypothetical protein
MQAADKPPAGSPGKTRPGGRKRTIPGGLTGNALVTGIICAALSGVISFVVARWQAGDAERQASASQQVTATVQLETDARAFVQEADQLIYVRRSCSGPAATRPDCKTAGETPAYDSP